MTNPKLQAPNPNALPIAKSQANAQTKHTKFGSWEFDFGI